MNSIKGEINCGIRGIESDRRARSAQHAARALKRRNGWRTVFVSVVACFSWGCFPGDVATPDVVIDVSSIDVPVVDPANIDCIPVLRHIAVVQKEVGGPIENRRAAARRIAAQYPHSDVARRTLLDFMRGPLGEMVPNDDESKRIADLTNAVLLCDPLMYELVTQQYYAAHPELRASQP